MYELKPIRYKKEYEEIIARRILKWLYENFYKGCFKIIDKNYIDNASNILIEAIKSGLIYYQDGAFYSKNARFSNTIAKELERIGAKYSKYCKAYLIDIKKLDIQLVWAIESLKAQTGLTADAIREYLTSQIGRLEELFKTLVIDTAVEKIMQDLQKRLFKTLDEKKISVISPKLTDFKKNEIAKNYTNNLEYRIRGWVEADIIKMRETAGQMAIEGKSKKAIADYIKKEFKVKDKKKSLFLARNETALATTAYLKAKYQEEGFTSFKWHTIQDGRERKLHRELNGKIFRFDDPPVIHESRGKVQKGLPGETYNCRCSFSPVYDKEFLENKRKRKR